MEEVAELAEEPSGVPSRPRRRSESFYYCSSCCDHVDDVAVAVAVADAALVLDIESVERAKEPREAAFCGLRPTLTTAWESYRCRPHLRPCQS